MVRGPHRVLPINASSRRELTAPIVALSQMTAKHYFCVQPEDAQRGRACTRLHACPSALHHQNVAIDCQHWALRSPRVGREACDLMTRLASLYTPIAQVARFYSSQCVSRPAWLDTFPAAPRGVQCAITRLAPTTVLVHNRFCRVASGLPEVRAGAHYAQPSARCRAIPRDQERLSSPRPRPQALL